MTLTREDILISRIVDGSAEPADWAELQEIAESEPEALRRLAEAQRREGDLRDAFGAALADAEDIELPIEHTATVYKFRTRLQAWTGWAAAAAVALAWLTAGGVLRSDTPASNVAGWTPPTTDEAYEQYQMLGLAEGRVLGELPKVMIQLERLENGQAEITYLRRVLERRMVTDVYEPGVDVYGRPTLNKADLTASRANDAL